MKLTEKQLEKIKSAKSAEEMIAFAKEEGLVLDEEKVNAMFAALPQNGELSDEQLDQVSGGRNYIIYADFYRCMVCGKEMSFKTDINGPHGTDVIMCCGQKMVFVSTRFIE